MIAHDGAPAAESVSWPENARCAVSFSFDVDGESAVLAANPNTAESMSVISHQRYGPTVGVRRLLDMLDRQGVQSTFFVPGFTAQLHPGVVRDIAAAGHEIAHHGYHHDKPAGLTVTQQIEQLDRGSEAIEALTGVRPVGYRAPMWDLSWQMPGLLLERGFAYDSSLMDDDFPYLLRPQDAKPSPGTTDNTIVEIPIQWALDDWEQYCYIPDVTELGPIQTPDHAIELWRSELEGMKHFGGCWVLTNHPFLSGRPGRALALEAFVAEVVEQRDVWIAPLHRIANHTRQHSTTVKQFQRIV